MNDETMRITAYFNPPGHHSEENIMAFCHTCNREVGVETSSRAIWIIGFLILGLIVPLWIITLPLFWGAALMAAVLPRARKCGICKSPV